jgi:glutamate-1-semialdehyde 2,1-aminomutase
VIGGGFPLAAIAGRADIMRHFDKAQVGAEGWLMQLGTLSGNPVAAVAGLKTMEVLRRDGAYDQLNGTGKRLMQATSAALEEAGVPFQIVGEPSLFEVVFTGAKVRDYRDTQAGDAERTKRYNAVLREEGIFKSPGKTYPSLALTEEDLQQTEAAIRKAAMALD